MNLTNTPKEVFEFLQKLEQVSETISGVNSVTRGNPDSSLKSGTALALVQSMSLQFMSGLQQSYVALMEDVGSGLINMLRDFAETPRIAMIAGERNKTNMKEFTGDDLSMVNRVIVDVGNPLARTIAGRVEMAEQLLQMGVVKTYQDYISIINTGKLEVLTEDEQAEMLLIRKENESLISGQKMMAIATDQHTLHIQEHKAVLADPDLRLDPQLLENTLAHIQEHIQLLRQTDPDLLSIIGEKPLGPVGGSPVNPQQGGAMPQGPAPSEQMQPPPPTQTTAPEQQGGAPQGLPGMPKPPAPFENLPVLPEDMPVE